MKKLLLLSALLTIFVGLNAQSIPARKPSTFSNKIGKPAAQFNNSALQNVKAVPFTAVPQQSVAFKNAQLPSKQTFSTEIVTHNGPRLVPRTTSTSATTEIDAYYFIPQGALIAGFIPNYYSYNDDILVAPAYSPITWEAYSDGTTSYDYSWEFGTYNGSATGQIIEKTLLPAVDYAPTLTVSDPSTSSSEYYQWGESLITGGAPDDVFEVGYLPGYGNYDLRYKFTAFRDVHPDSLANMNLGLGAYRGYANVFDIAASPYIVDTVYVHVGNLVPKTDEPYKLTVRKINSDRTLGDIIATAETYPNEVILAASDGGMDYYTVPFVFKEVDEYGYEYNYYFDVADNPVFVEFYNFEDAQEFFQYESNPDGVNYAYLTFENGVLGFHDWGRAISSLIDFHAILPWLAADDPVWNIPDAGGNHTFSVQSYWDPEVSDTWWVESEDAVPSWLKVEGISLDRTSWVTSLEMSADPLPVGITGRSAEVTIYSWACQMTLEFYQGDAVAIDQISTTSPVKVYRNGDDFILSYPSEVDAVSVYSVSGQKVSDYRLDKSGSFTLPTSNLANGVYILNFNGINKSLKLIK